MDGSTFGSFLCKNASTYAFAQHYGNASNSCLVQLVTETNVQRARWGVAPETQGRRDPTLELRFDCSALVVKDTPLFFSFLVDNNYK